MSEHVDVDILIVGAGPVGLFGAYYAGFRALRVAPGDRFRVTSREGAVVTCGAIIVTGGIGTFTPRPLPAGSEFLGRGLSYFVPDLQAPAGQDVVIVGGGDSAFDWALGCSRSRSR